MCTQHVHGFLVTEMTTFHYKFVQRWRENNQQNFNYFYSNIIIIVEINELYIRETIIKTSETPRKTIKIILKPAMTLLKFLQGWVRTILGTLSV